MIRFQTISSKVAHRVGVLTRFMPPLGAPAMFEQSTSYPVIDFTQRASRNLWNRADLVSAIGQDPPEADADAHVWPPSGLRR